MRRLRWPQSLWLLVAAHVLGCGSVHLKGEDDNRIGSSTADFQSETNSADSSLWSLLAHMVHSSHASISSRVSMGGSPINDKLISWAEKTLETVNTNDATNWPKLEMARDTWDTGLRSPHVYAISMLKSKKRRESMAKQIKKSGMRVAELHWAPAVDGYSIPIGLVNPSGKNATDAEAFFLHRPGVLGCYLSHLLVFRRHLKTCPSCDMMIFEDDAAFHPFFKQKFLDFMSGMPPQMLVDSHDGRMNGTKLPVARLHIGGDAFWEKPAAETAQYFQVSAASRTWGYAVRREFTQSLLQFLRSRNLRQNMGVDEQLSGRDFVSRFPVLAPKKPLVRALPASSHTGSLVELEDKGVGWDPFLWTPDCWAAVYIGTGICVNETKP